MEENKEWWENEFERIISLFKTVIDLENKTAIKPNFTEAEKQLKSFISFALQKEREQIRQEIAEYAGINDIQTKSIINLIHPQSEGSKENENRNM